MRIAKATVATIMLVGTMAVVVFAAMTTSAAKQKAVQLWGKWGAVDTIEQYGSSTVTKRVGVMTPGCAPKFQVFGEAQSDFSLAFADAAARDLITGNVWLEPYMEPTGISVTVFYASGLSEVISATFLGETGEDFVGADGVATGNGVKDWHLKLAGMKGRPVRVRVESTAGVWESPTNGVNWALYVDYDAPRINGPFKGILQLRGSAFDNKSLLRSQWVVDGADYAPPNLIPGDGVREMSFATALDTATLPNGVHYVCQRVSDRNGNTNISPAVLFRTDQTNGAMVEYWRPSSPGYSNSFEEAAPGISPSRFEKVGN